MRYKFTQEIKNFGDYKLSLHPIPGAFKNHLGEDTFSPAGSIACTRKNKDGADYSFLITDNIHDSLAYWQMGIICTVPD